MITTQLDSLSTATDNNDNHPTISKFPETRPLKFISKQYENGQDIALIVKYVNIFAVPICVFFILVKNVFYFVWRFVSISLYIQF